MKKTVDIKTKLQYIINIKNNSPAPGRYGSKENKMSTRSNIFVDFNGERKQFYHHHDGYLAGVGKDLLVRMEMAIARARKVISYLVGDNFSTERVYKEFLNLLEEEGFYEPEEIRLHGDIEYLYYVKFVPGKKYTVSYTETQWQELEDEDYRQNLETAECGEHRISLSIKID